MIEPKTREQASARARALDRVILAARKQGLHAEADRLTKDRDALVRRWAQQFDLFDRQRGAAE